MNTDGTQIQLNSWPQQRNLRRGMLLMLGMILLYPFFTHYIFPGSVELLVPAIGEMAARCAYELPGWLYGGLALILALRWQRWTFANLGLRSPTWSSLGWGLLGVIATFALALIVKALFSGLPQPAEDLLANGAYLRGSLPYALLIAIRAGVVEEFLYRGLLVEQLTRLTGRPWLAISLSGLIFLFSHGLSFNWMQMAMAAVATVILSLMYFIRRDLWANIFAHFLIDFISFMHVLPQNANTI